MLVMSPTDIEIQELRAKLHNLDAEFDRAMRVRGFDPAQAENMALPSNLARLYAEREQIRAQLQDLEGESDD